MRGGQGRGRWGCWGGCDGAQMKADGADSLGVYLGMGVALGDGCRWGVVWPRFRYRAMGIATNAHNAMMDMGG